MNLEELVQELRENMLFDRSARVEGTPDYLWSPATLVRYIDEAHRRFARQSLTIRDNTTPAVTQVTLVAGQTEYLLHRSVLAVLSARRVGDIGDLARTGHSILNAYRGPDPTYWDPAQLSQLPPGKPLVFATDESIGVSTDSGAVERVVMRVYPVPSAEFAGDVIQLRVLRLPMERFVVESMEDQYPEIPEVHHLEMLDWAAYLALRVADHDAGNAKRAAEFFATFEAHAKQARTEMLRKIFTPQPWGFGRNGFSWER